MEVDDAATTISPCLPGVTSRLENLGYARLGKRVILQFYTLRFLLFYSSVCAELLVVACVAIKFCFRLINQGSI
jgi:hypothetical protein